MLYYYKRINDFGTSVGITTSLNELNIHNFIQITEEEFMELTKTFGTPHIMEPEEPIDPQDNPDIVKLQEQVEELEAAFDALTEGLV